MMIVKIKYAKILRNPKTQVLKKQSNPKFSEIQQIKN
jgi:hypothetical protein